VLSIMGGIAGILASTENVEMDSILQKMASAIRHRSLESYYTVNHNQAKCAIVGPHASLNTKSDLVIVDSNSDLACPNETQHADSLSKLFSVIAITVDESGVNLQRSLDGTRSLYYGYTENTFVFATERKCLWSTDITQQHTLEPGQRVAYSWEGNLKKERFVILERPQVVETSRLDTLNNLKKTLLASFEKLQRTASCAVLFSGGVDSTLTAVQVANRCEKTFLVTTSHKKAHDASAAMRAADVLGFPLDIIELDPCIVWNVLPRVIYSIETSKQMDVEIALPFYLASRKAVDMGCSTVVSGQGPDELFAGYAKHVRIFSEEGPKALNEQLWREVSITHDANIERDERAIAAHGLESFFPYLDQDFVHLSLEVPAEWKVNPTENPQRKVIFRELAQSMGVPTEIALAPKNATQFSSGSSKVILEAIIQHVDGFQGMSKKEASKRVQDVLNEIAFRLHMPNVQRSDEELSFEMKAIDNVTKGIG
jgi:asparagine synthetase B (glutamine-hydrolysing)